MKPNCAEALSSRSSPAGRTQARRPARTPPGSIRRNSSRKPSTRPRSRMRSASAIFWAFRFREPPRPRRDPPLRSSAPLEMKSPYVSDLQPEQIVHATFLVAHKDVRQKKSGDPYLSLILCDRSGELDAKMWDNAAEVLDAFQRDDFVRVKGLLQIFQNRPQLTLHKIQLVPESEVDVSD